MALFPPSSVSTAPHSSVSSADLLRVCLIPLYMSLTRELYSPNIWPLRNTNHYSPHNISLSCPAMSPILSLSQVPSPLPNPALGGVLSTDPILLLLRLAFTSFSHRCFSLFQTPKSTCKSHLVFSSLSPFLTPTQLFSSLLLLQGQPGHSVTHIQKHPLHQSQKDVDHSFSKAK